jgi:hypothetical protein
LSNEQRIVLLAQIQDVGARLSLGNLDRLAKFAEALREQETGKRQKRRSRHSKPVQSIHPVGY